MAQTIASTVAVSVCTYITDILFREVVIINDAAIPRRGPLMLYGNHNNQFIDGMLMKRACPRPISFITAASSLRKPVIGPLMSSAGAIPLERAQDLAKPGAGYIIKIQNDRLIGEKTQFTKIKPGETLDLGLVLGEVRIVQTISDTEMVVSKLPQGDYELPLKYKVLPKLDYNQVYSNVWEKLNEGGCVGIFPEGGSHDRLEMLPLKAGICIFALGAMEKYNIQVTLMSCGFNYFNPQKYRSKVIMEFGVPYTIPMDMLQLYKTNRKQAISTLLKEVEQRLLVVTTHSRNFNSLSTVFTLRELYMLGATQRYTEMEKVEINRRLLKGIQDLHVENNTEVSSLLQEVEQLDAFVRNNGLSLNHTLKQNSLILDVVIFFFYLIKTINRILFTLPGFILLAPSIQYIAWASEKERIKCLKNSKVKIEGNDVVGSTKFRLSIMVLPITFLFISLLAFFLTTKYTDWSKATRLLISILVFILFPFYLKQMMPSVDTLNHTWKKLKYLFLRLFKRSSVKKFNKARIELAEKVKQMVKKHAVKIFPDFDKIRIVSKKEMDEAAKVLENKRQEIATPRASKEKEKGFGERKK